MKVQIALVLFLALANAQTGGWKKENVKVFTATNNVVLTEAQQAVETKYHPLEQGYEFEDIVSIETQVVAGTNYDIVLEYINQDGQTQYYDVIVYSAPWAGPDQVTKCQQINNEPNEFTTPTMLNQVPTQINLRAGKQSKLKLRIQQQQSKTVYASTGGWETINPNVFASSNDNVLDQAEQAVEQQYNPESQGYEFEEVLKVQTQVVSGTNYNIELLYTNGEGDYITYDVVLYICPWNPSANQQKVTEIGEYSI